MLKVPVYNLEGKQVGEQTLNPAVFEVAVKPGVVQEALLIQQSNARAPIAHTKDRAQVAGGGKKPWKQKGTGRARHGSIRSPLWRGGGITFGPTKDRNFSQKINRKQRRKAILMCLSDKAAAKRILVLETLALPEIKTKPLYTALQSNGLRPSAKKVSTKEKEAIKKKKSVARLLLVLSQKDSTVQKSARNIDRLASINANSLNVAELVKADWLVMPVAALAAIESTFVKS